VIICKINTITEDKLIVTDMKISSKICDDVIFYIGYEDSDILGSVKDAWWNENNPSVSMTTKKHKKEKIVDLKKDSIDWNTLGLGWKEESKKGEVVFIPIGK
jgi:hypothetical protein